MKNNCILAVLTDKQHNEISNSTTYVVENIELLIEEASILNDCNIVIDSTSKTAYKHIKLAEKHHLSIAKNNQIINISKMNEKSLASLLLSSATTKHEGIEATRRMAYSLSKDVPSKMSRKDAIAAIRGAAPNIMIEGQSASDYAENQLVSLLEHIYEEVRKTHSVSLSNENTIHLKMDYDENLIEHIKNNPGIYILDGDLGSGKTQNGTLPAFEAFMEMGLFPIITSPRKLLTAQTIDAKYHYQNPALREALKNPFGKQPTGVGSVINSLFFPLFENYRENESNAIIIEEIEEALNHLTGKAVSKCLLARTEMMSGFMKLIKEKKYVVMADGTISDHTVNMLAKNTGKKIHIVSPVSFVNKEKIQINVFKNHAENNARISEVMNSGGSIAAFVDASHNKNKSEFRALFRAREEEERRALMIDAASLVDKDPVSFINELEVIIRDHNYTQFSPVISSGNSFTNTGVTEVSILAHQTISPRSAIQSMRRFRDVPRVNFSITPEPKNYPTDPMIVLALEMNESMDASKMGPGSLAEYSRNPGVMLVIERITQENRDRNNYANYVLIAAEQKGWAVKLVDSNEDAAKEGRKITKRGQELENEARSNSLIAARPLSDAEANSIRGLAGYAQEDEQHMLAAYDIRKAFKMKRTDAITPEIIALDANGSGQKIVRNYNRTHKLSKLSNASEVIMVMFIKEALSILNIDTKTMTGSYNSEDAQRLADWVKKGSIEYSNGMRIRTIVALNKHFGDITISSTGGRVASSLLKRLFALDTKSEGQITINKKRVRSYKIEHNDKSRMAMIIRDRKMPE
ncbi:hypothetical protein [Oceanisphaera ostreae]|uniref:Helicase ATP-binding domain-containing protein n=1 Tax=Oceanisphaera ostreae TaxID=914151 RepID=A0ABW3KD86_9GAMM